MAMIDKYMCKPGVAPGLARHTGPVVSSLFCVYLSAFSCSSSPSSSLPMSDRMRESSLCSSCCGPSSGSGISASESPCKLPHSYRSRTYNFEAQRRSMYHAKLCLRSGNRRLSRVQAALISRTSQRSRDRASQRRRNSGDTALEPKQLRVMCWCTSQNTSF